MKNKLKQKLSLKQNKVKHKTETNEPNFTYMKFNFILGLEPCYP